MNGAEKEKLRALIREIVEQEYILVEDRQRTKEKMRAALQRAMLNYCQVQLSDGNPQSVSHWMKEITACFDDFDNRVKVGLADHPAKILPEVREMIEKELPATIRRAARHLDVKEVDISTDDFWSRVERIVNGEYVGDVITDWHQLANRRVSQLPPRQ